MSRWSRLIPAVAFGVLLAACGESGSPIEPSGPSMNDGWIVGGNKTSQDSTVTTNSTNNPPPADSTNRGWIVGGN